MAHFPKVPNVLGILYYSSAYELLSVVFDVLYIYIYTVYKMAGAYIESTTSLISCII